MKILLVLLVLVQSCGKGSKGNPGNDGESSSYGVRSVELESTCSVTASPSCSTNLIVKSGKVSETDFTVVVPSAISVDNSPVQSSNNNGFITLKVGSLIYCYQRKNQNSTDPVLRRRHDLSGMKFTGSCGTGVDNTVIQNYVESSDAGEPIELTVHGPFTVGSVPTTFKASISLEIKTLE